MIKVLAPSELVANATGARWHKKYQQWLKTRTGQKAKQLVKLCGYVVFAVILAAGTWESLRYKGNDPVPNEIEVSDFR